MREWLKNHEQMAYLVGFVLLACGVLIGLGRVELHNELEREVYVEEFLGYVNDEEYNGTVTITAEDMPQWCQNLGVTGEGTVEFADGISGQIGIFADVIYFENRYELRTWFSGRTLEGASEFYYRLNSPIQLEPVYQPLECRIDVNNIRGAEYDYQAFKGENTDAEDEK